MAKLIQIAKSWGLSVGLSPDGENLRIYPWSTVTKEQREWFVQNKPLLIRELKSRKFDSVEYRGSDYDGSFPEFLKKRTLFGDAVANAIEKHFVSALIPKDAESKGCGCSDYAKKLNKKGVQFCIETRSEIERELVERSNVLIAGAKLIPNALKRWQVEKIIDEAIRNTTPKRSKLPDDVAVVIASDAGFSNGLYCSAWSTIYQNDANVVAYDLGGIQRRKVEEMQRWGIEFKKWDSVISTGVDGWQTYNKPFLIRDAMERFGRVIWIDSDVLIGGDLSPVLEMLNDGLVVPDHGFFDPPNNNNSDCIVDVLGIAKKQWGQPANAFPCCGFMAFNSARDKKFVDSWCDAIQRVESQNAFDCVSYYDQGVFTQIYDGRLVDGRIWNNLRVPRRGSAETILKHCFSNQSVVNHSGGEIKFWQPWLSLNWANPNFVGSE